MDSIVDITVQKEYRFPIYIPSMKDIFITEKFQKNQILVEFKIAVIILTNSIKNRFAESISEFLVYIQYIIEYHKQYNYNIPDISNILYTENNLI